MEREESREKTTKKHTKLFYALGAVALAALFFAGGWGAMWLSLGPNARALLWAVDTAEKRYYKDVSEDEIYDALMRGFPDALDIYSAYFSNDDYGAELDRTAGRSAGYGISIRTAGGSPQLYSVAGNSPAELAGLRKGMYILGFGTDEGTLASGTRDEFVAFLDATEGEIVLRCGYEPDGKDAKICRVLSSAYQTSYCLYRDMDGSFRFDPNDLNVLNELGEPLEGAGENTAYIRLEKFYGKAAEEFEACLKLMKERGRSDLILDLRGNGGGYLTVFCNIAAHLINAEEKRPAAATARYRDGSESTFYTPASDYSAYFGEDAKIRILADEDTASASECLIGALVSYGTVGYGDIYLHEAGNGAARTYGKGIMQSTYTDSAGNALKLTVAEIFWPNGTSIHGKGVTKEDGAVGIAADAFFTAQNDAMLAQTLQTLTA